MLDSYVIASARFDAENIQPKYQITRYDRNLDKRTQKNENFNNLIIEEK